MPNLSFQHMESFMSNFTHSGNSMTVPTSIGALDHGKRVVFSNYRKQFLRCSVIRSSLLFTVLCVAPRLPPCHAAAESAVSSRGIPNNVTADPAVQALTINLTGLPLPIMKGHLGLGMTRSPNGITLNADSRCLYRNGQPWIPVWGEFHYSRYPSEEWRDQLLKMKAGGIDIVAFSDIWIHHEEKQGESDWSGQRCLRRFVQLCHELGLLVVVRVGPWAHAEVRNGGLPDWVQHSGLRLRSRDPAFVKLVNQYWTQLSGQMRGLFWKDGGPIIGILLEDECKDLSYVFSLKTMARSLGWDVPFYFMTGWQSNLPREGVMPMSGNYADGFWTHDFREFLDSFMFRPVELVGKASMGAFEKDSGFNGVSQMGRYPFLTCELGGGMVSGYDRRIRITPPDVAAVALVTMGNGSNMPGYYMFQGGTNPEGKYSTLNESKASGYPRDLPVKDYDFSAPLGACGQVRKHYHLLRQQHLFLQQFGQTLATMPAFLPDHRLASLDDVTTMRWAVRSDGRRGFLFFNNYQRFVRLPAKEGVQFSLKTTDGTQLVPLEPITIPSGVYGLWPVNLDCVGVTVNYSTAQPICSLKADNQSWFFFAAIEGIQPDFVLSDAGGQTRIRNITPATAVAFTRLASDGRKVNFVVLSVEQGRQLWKLPLAGRQRVVLSPNAILPDSNSQIRVETSGTQPLAIAVFPPITTAVCNGSQVASLQDGIFQRFTLSLAAPSAVAAKLTHIRSADWVGDKSLDAMKEESWRTAAAWRLAMPKDLGNRRLLLQVHYLGDVARVYAGGKLIADNFYNGEPFDFAYWRIPGEVRDTVEVHIMPLRADHLAFLPADSYPSISTSRGRAEISRIECVERTRATMVLKDEARSP